MHNVSNEFSILKQKTFENIKFKFMNINNTFENSIINNTKNKSKITVAVMVLKI